MLLAAGAKVTPNKGGVSPLDMAIGINPDAAEELIAAGARLEASKVKDYLAAYKDNPRAVELVKKAAPR
jgi:hypothetical protein